MTGRKIHEMIKNLALGMTWDQWAGTDRDSLAEANQIRRIHAAGIAEEREALRKAGRFQ
ncbi:MULTISPECIES: hypothetical protein [Acutalibacteraceae]|uniref:hypothetical protein n=1 Tax=Acutalibacteraceae TaxID=3082771 RepID=UPI0013E8BC5D|nr:MULTISPECIES: hypothetical protein [Acutalibacteraceae]